MNVKGIVNIKGVIKFRSFTWKGWFIFSIIPNIFLLSFCIEMVGVIYNDIPIIKFGELVDYSDFIPLSILFFSVIKGDSWLGLTRWK